MISFPSHFVSFFPFELSLVAISIIFLAISMPISYYYFANTKNSKSRKSSSSADSASAAASDPVGAGLSSLDPKIRSFLFSLGFPAPHTNSPSLPSLVSFAPLKQKSNCIFARNSKIIGSAPWDSAVSLERNVLHSIPSLIDFTMKIQYLTNFMRVSEEQLNNWEAVPNKQRTVQIPMKHRLDGFLFEIRGSEYCNSIELFSRSVHRVLAAVSKYDPLVNSNQFESEAEDDSSAAALSTSWEEFLSRHPHRPTPKPGNFHYTADGIPALPAPMQFIDSPSWHFHFMGEPYFVTCFAPFYPASHARFMFDSGSIKDDQGVEVDQRCFILLQPEFSFAVHNLSPDTPETRWENPLTERDQIRVAFHSAGRSYFIPKSVVYASSRHVVPPLDHREEEKVIRWFETRIPADDQEETPQQQEQEYSEEDDQEEAEQETQSNVTE